MTQFEVTTKDHLKNSRLSDAGKDRVLTALSNGYDAVLWAEEWVIRENDFQTLSGASRLVGLASVERTTKNGILVTQGDIEAWVGKSVCELYRNGGEIDLESTSQRFIGDYDG